MGGGPYNQNSTLGDLSTEFVAQVCTLTVTGKPKEQASYGSFRKFGVPYFGVLIIRILPLSGSPIFGNSHMTTLQDGMTLYRVLVLLY